MARVARILYHVLGRSHMASHTSMVSLVGGCAFAPLEAAGAFAGSSVPLVVGKWPRGIPVQPYQEVGFLSLPDGCPQ